MVIKKIKRTYLLSPEAVEILEQSAADNHRKKSTQLDIILKEFSSKEEEDKKRTS